MKHALYSLISVLLITSFQCTKEIPVAVDPINLEMGKVALRIDKANSPASVIVVEALLTRLDHDSLSEELNLLNSNSADIIFNEVPAGEWHLKVDAKDTSGMVLYTGETELSVLAGVLTQVNLTLIPTGDGAGSIYILVTWGSFSTWVDYIANPIFTIEQSYNSPIAITQAKIFKEDSIYKMWYNNLYGSAVTDIGYAESPNGISWQSISNFPVLQTGNYGEWDDYSVQVGSVICDDNTYKMYYTGMRSQHDQWHIGMATSSDGINWIKHPLPVIQANSNEPRLHVDCVLKHENVYYMFYSILNPNNSQYYKIGMATSSDGLNWTRNPSNPILSYSQVWENKGVYFPSVIIENDVFKMVYMNSSANGFGMATSSDGFYWYKNNSNPFFTANQTNDHWAYRITYPNLVKLNNEYRIYYTGEHGNQNISSIGFLRKPVN